MDKASEELYTQAYTAELEQFVTAFEQVNQQEDGTDILVAQKLLQRIVKTLVFTAFLEKLERFAVPFPETDGNQLSKITENIEEYPYTKEQLHLLIEAFSILNRYDSVTLRKIIVDASNESKNQLQTVANIEIIVNKDNLITILGGLNL